MVGQIAVSGLAGLTEMYPHRLSVVVGIKAYIDLKEKSFEICFIHPSIHAHIHASIHTSIHPSHMVQSEFLTDSGST